MIEKTASSAAGSDDSSVSALGELLAYFPGDTCETQNSIKTTFQTLTIDVNGSKVVVLLPGEQGD